MKLILDANPLFSALIKDSITVKIIVSDYAGLYAPQYLFDEFLEHRDEVTKKTKRSEDELNNLIDTLKSIITVVPKKEFEHLLERAKELTTDKDDVPYVALALKLNIPIWSNDKKLKKQDKVQVYSTGEILEILKKYFPTN